ncbi:hypothetical protein TNIN_107031 [Trichonephila inaurata madagascariensis]|uniref:Uncharacterized protein n=1 Tax=Trichonephila inaurata madagascariensis TaxID=2747483 RepID=A0A8X6YQ36_9ARAC|nr:hypothetical protein TNIN_107031 [Trichonephila inaurata madagascariensis]
MTFPYDCLLTAHISVLPRLKVTSIEGIKTSFLRANSLELSTIIFTESSLQRFTTGIFIIEYAGSLQSFMTYRRKGFKTASSEVTSKSSRVSSDRPQSIRAPEAFKKFHPKIMSWLQSGKTMNSNGKEFDHLFQFGGYSSLLDVHNFHWRL